MLYEVITVSKLESAYVNFMDEFSSILHRQTGAAA